MFLGEACPCLCVLLREPLEFSTFGKCLITKKRFAQSNFCDPRATKRHVFFRLRDVAAVLRECCGSVAGVLRACFFQRMTWKNKSLLSEKSYNRFFRVAGTKPELTCAHRLQSNVASQPSHPLIFDKAWYSYSNLAV